MKQRRKKRRSPRPLAGPLVPALEECLSFVMGGLSYSSDAEKRPVLSATEKYRFKSMERRIDVLSLDEYCEILRRVLAPGLRSMIAESGEHLTTVETELREFRKRYELLSSRIVPGLAERDDVRWALAHRFLVPWLALRIAFRISADAETGEGVRRLLVCPSSRWSDVLMHNEGHRPVCASERGVQRRPRQAALRARSQ